MLADDGTPVLMDLGSCIKARVRIHNRSQALVQQDMAAEHSSMPYRAPELFDVKSNTTLDEKVDIWVGVYRSEEFIFLTSTIVFGLHPLCPRLLSLSI